MPDASEHARRIWDVNCWMLQKIHLLCEVGKY